MATSVDPDQMLLSAASDLGQHCLPRPGPLTVIMVPTFLWRNIRKKICDISISTVCQLYQEDRRVLLEGSVQLEMCICKILSSQLYACPYTSIRLTVMK